MIKKLTGVLLAIALSTPILHAANGFNRDWYLQVGAGATQTLPYDRSLGEALGNGTCAGIDIAAGKWFTPNFGLRLRGRWDSGNPKAPWLYYPNYEKASHAGMVTFVGDVQIDLISLCGGANPNRIYRLIVFPRAGVGFNFGTSKGTPVLGIGISNNWRLSRHVSLYLDAAYHAVSSGYICGRNPVGAAFNSYAEVNAGVQIDLTKDVEDGSESDYNIMDWWYYRNKNYDKHPYARHWFLEVGMDVTLQNPYGLSFLQAANKGLSFGFDAAVGKWFHPMVGVRLRANLENAIANPHCEWIAKNGMYIAAYMDVPFSLWNAIVRYEEANPWNVYIFPRAGIVSNLAIKSGSPLVGAGAGFSYRMAPHTHLYVEMAYQITTSEFTGGIGMTGMKVATGCNGYLDTHVGIRWSL